MIIAPQQSIITQFQDLVFTSSRFFYDINMIYPIYFIDYLSNNLKIWSKHVEKFANLKVEENITRDKETPDLEKLFETYRLVFKVLKIIEKVFGLADYTGTEMIYLIVVRYMCWVMKIFTLIIILSTKCECLDTNIRNANTTTLIVLKCNKDLAVSRFCKNVLRVSGCEYDAWSACGLFTVDARLPLRVIGVVATYTVVLLQFALL
ncbi:unnamed protein product [Plutella xylostella]|uniref:(diamondback moth) hypothetical protein n=1 Tax=Plutella xylostella TaxID=51655 RepID=A0A8S4FWM3_PLUXY|nr:unnamed protein product [Plutella xylostella]